MRIPHLPCDMETSELRFVSLTERANRHADNHLVYRFGLACVTGDCDSLIDMQGAAVAKHLAFIEYDPALINADHGP